MLFGAIVSFLSPTLVGALQIIKNTEKFGYLDIFVLFCIVLECLRRCLWDVLIE